jgi:hypothetical protein
MMSGDEPFMPSSTLDGGDKRARFAANPPPTALAAASRRPGLDTAIAAMNAPPSLASSLMAMGLGVPTSGPARSRLPQMDRQAALFRWLGLPSSWLPSQPDAVEATVPAVDGQQTVDHAVELEGSVQDPGAIQPVAGGDLRCKGFNCKNGGSFGTTGAWVIERRKVCRDCAVKILGIGQLPSTEQTEILQPFELGR